jgi:hypothetical protein
MNGVRSVSRIEMRTQKVLRFCGASSKSLDTVGEERAIVLRI